MRIIITGKKNIDNNEDRFHHEIARRQVQIFQNTTVDSDHKDDELFASIKSLFHALGKNVHDLRQT